MYFGFVDFLLYSGITHTILKYKDYFINITPKVTSLKTRLGQSTLIECFSKAQFMLSNGTPLTIYETLYCRSSIRNLLSYKDIQENKFHIETAREKGIKYL